MKLLSTLLILTATQFSTAALAGNYPEAPKNYHIECESCVTESQFTQVAKDNAVSEDTVNINVMNFANYQIEKYRVHRISKTVCDPNGREPNGEGEFIYDCWLQKTLTADKLKMSNRDFAPIPSKLTLREFLYVI